MRNSKHLVCLYFAWCSKKMVFFIQTLFSFDSISKFR